MNEKIEVMGVNIDSLTASEAVEKVKEYLKTDELNTVGVIFASTLIEAERQPDWLTQLDQLDLKVIGDREVLEVAGLDDVTHIDDVEHFRFIQGVLQHITSEQKKATFLVEDNEDKEFIQKYLGKSYPNIKIAGIFSLDDATEDEDSLVNLLNGVVEGIIIAALPSPYQEEFLFTHKAKLSTRAWIGLGQSAFILEEMDLKPKFLGKLIEKTKLKRKISRYQNEKED